jgi:hypothetical protein
MIRSTGLYFKLPRIHEHADTTAEALTEMGLSGRVLDDVQGNVQMRILLAGCQSGRTVEGEEEFLDFWEGGGMPWKRLRREFSWEVSVGIDDLPKLLPIGPRREQGNIFSGLYVCTSVFSVPCGKWFAVDWSTVIASSRYYYIR